MTPEAPEEKLPRIQFPQECPRCKFKHAKGKACPRCADTLDLDTAWSSAYSDSKRALARRIREYYNKRRQEMRYEECD